MRKLEGVRLTAVLAVAAALAGCDQQPVRVCVDAQGRRIPDQPCATSAAVVGAHWRYYGGGVTTPAVGEPATGGSDVADHSASYSAAPEEGVSRGGFGGTAEDVGGHGGGGDE